MQAPINCSLMASIVAAGLTTLTAACASNKVGSEYKKDTTEPISLADLAAPARLSVEKLTAGGKIEKIEKEVEKGNVVYDVEATVNGKHVECTVAIDGTVVGTETSIDYSDLPEAVRTAAAVYFGSATGLRPSKGVEDGKTSYEIEGKKGGNKVAVTFDETGKVVGREE
jgi:uncharacterized membrane protein YkoI